MEGKRCIVSRLNARCLEELKNRFETSFEIEVILIRPKKWFIKNDENLKTIQSFGFNTLDR